MKQRPVGICDVCGNYAYREEEINQGCRAHHQGETCTGGVTGAVNDSDWEKCPACTGKGLDVVDCPQCAGAGWLPL
ncbi:MAG: hypothetical protein R3352_10045 [Salinisphaeraceae bacterium]|nr:hypothetical protein [Salinisphaeraceae bacterium]